MVMTLARLAVAAHVYPAISGSDPEFWSRAGAGFNLDEREDVTWLLGWLNRYGCRQFKKSDHLHVARDLGPWWRANERVLPSRDAGLIDLDGPTIAAIQIAHYELSRVHACTRSTGVIATIGPVGASKLLFALRPKSLPPWDRAIREKLQEYEHVASYSDYLWYAKDVLSTIAQECQRRGLDVATLPARLGRPEATLAKLLDEYHWLTITRGYQLPDTDTLRDWLEWSARDARSAARGGPAALTSGSSGIV